MNRATRRRFGQRSLRQGYAPDPVRALSERLPGLPGGPPYVPTPVQAIGRLLVPMHVMKRLAGPNPISEYIRAQQHRAWGIPCKEWRDR